MIKQIQIIFKYKKYLRTGYLPLIFKKGDKVLAVNEDLENGQEGILTKIVCMATNKEVEETEEGYKYLVEIEGIDKKRFPTSKEYYKQFNK